MKFAIFELSASVDIRLLPGAWVAPRCRPRGPGPLKNQISTASILFIGS